MNREKYVSASWRHGQELVMKCGMLRTQLFFSCCYRFRPLFSMKNLISTRQDMTNLWVRLMERRTPSRTMRMLSCCHANPWCMFYTSHQRYVVSSEVIILTSLWKHVSSYASTFKQLVCFNQTSQVKNASEFINHNAMSSTKLQSNSSEVKNASEFIMLWV